MRWRSHIRTNLMEGLSPVIDLVYPPRCPLCGASTASQGGLCTDCWEGIEVPGEPSCHTCQRPLAQSGFGAGAGQGGQCFTCRQAPLRHRGIIAACVYNDASRRLILTFKHGGKVALSPLLANLMASRLRSGLVENPLLIPVPLHRWRLWQRGFNQAALLAQELHKRGKGEVLVDALVRHKRTPSLGGLGSEARARALAGAISARPAARASISGRNILLVDDVFTSGATSNACIDALLEAGALSVRIVCFARVIDGAPGKATGR